MIEVYLRIQKISPCHFVSHKEKVTLFKMEILCKNQMILSKSGDIVLGWVSYVPSERVQTEDNVSFPSPLWASVQMCFS